MSAPDCRACGACCGYAGLSEGDEQVVPARTLLRLVYDEDAGGEVLERRYDAAGHLRCHALAGVIGRRVACTIYAARPIACRAAEPGSEWCEEQRRMAGVGRAEGGMHGY